MHWRIVIVIVLSFFFLLAGKVELHGKVIEVDYSVPKKLR